LKYLYILLFICILAILLCSASSAASLDTSSGRVIAVPVSGKITIDGSLNDWDLSGLEQVTLDIGDANALHADYALMYDSKNLYLAVKVADTTPARNAYGPEESKYWDGDCVQLRICSDPGIATPLPNSGNGMSAENLGKISHIGFWHNHLTGKNWIHIARGNDSASTALVNPAGSQLAFKTWPDGKGYTFESAIPWTALGVESAPKTGSVLPALLEILWGDGQGRAQVIRAAAVYTHHPTTFGFSNWSMWGQLVLSPLGKLSRPGHLTLEKIRAKSAGTRVPITLSLKKPGAVSINVLDAKGNVVRELVRETKQPVGKLTINWDGRNYAGQPVAPGNYKWKAISYSPVSATYIGGVGSSGEPPYDTPDGNGAWGSDHVNPLDTASDTTGNYFLWSMAEQGRSVIKTDLSGKTLWRKSPVARNHWGDFTSIAADGKCVYVLSGMAIPEIIRLDAANGSYMPYSQDRLGAVISENDLPAGMTEWTATGLAVRNGIGCVSLYYENRIAVVDLSDGHVTNSLRLDRPYGLCYDSKGNLFAISRGTESQPARIVRFDNANGDPIDVISTNLLEPADLAVMTDGSILVTDPSPKSNQIKEFSAGGKLLKTIGKAGGRPYAGKYQPKDFLRPWGITPDINGGFLVAENSAPKVITWYKADGSIRKRWFGPGTYGTSVWGDSADPFSVYWLACGSNAMTGSWARSRINTKTGKWDGPEAYWDLEHGGFPKEFQKAATIFNMPQFSMYKGRKYISSNFEGMSVMRVDGDKMVPMGYLSVGLDGRPLMVSMSVNASVKSKSGKPITQRHQQLPIPFTNGIYLEAEKSSSLPSPDKAISSLYSSEYSTGWVDTVDDGDSSQAVVSLQLANQQWPLHGLWLRWNLPGKSIAPGRYEVYARIRYAGNNVPYMIGISAGTSADSLTARIKPEWTNSSIQSYVYSWIKVGDLALAASDKIVQLDIPQINSAELRLDCVALKKVDPALPPNVGGASSLYGYGMDENLNIYFQANRKIVRISCLGLDRNGYPRWDNAHYRILVNDYCPGVPDVNMVNPWRRQGRGIGTDNQSNMYVAWNAGPESSGPFWSAHITSDRLQKYSPSGKLLWAVGQKAMGPRKDGEMYDTFLLGGIVNNHYIVMADEPGMIHFYTSDGLYRGNIFNDLAKGPEPGPYTFTGETFSGRVLYDKKTSKYYAYQGQTAGLMFEVNGLGSEQSYNGSVKVTAAQLASGDANKADPMGAISQVSSDFSIDGPEAQWSAMYPFTMRRGSNRLASVYMGYNEKSVFARWDVADDTPQKNGADDVEMGFTGGDSVGLYLGPAGDRTQPVLGDLRIMVVPNNKNGQLTVIGMKPITNGSKLPRTYRSPQQSAVFDWVGSIPGAKAVSKPYAGGYSVVVSIPRTFVENLNLAPGLDVKFDSEVLLSDTAGKKTLSRNFLFAKGPEVSMVNDVPTEARLYPAKWKEMELRQNPDKPVKSQSAVSYLAVKNLFDEKSAVILEAEQAEEHSKGFWFFGAGHAANPGPGVLIDDAGLDKPLKIAWNLPDSLKPGKYTLWLSWTSVSCNDAKIDCTFSLGPDASSTKPSLVASVDNGECSWNVKWGKVGEIEIKQGEKSLLFEPVLKDTYAAVLLVDALAFVPIK